jgi:anhydro-N-acetylmuramic acid kinase
LDLLRAMNAADGAVASAVALALPEIAKVVEAIVARVPQGGRVFYVGAGTSGRLAVVEASEWYPTFGVAPELVQAIIAGGAEAVFRSVEGAEDKAEQGAADLATAGAGEKDIVIGITASGTTPYVLGALKWATAQNIFAAALVCNRVPKLPAAVTIELITGGEFVEGSSRLKAGTATKMALNLISTVAMIRLGKVHAGRMVEVRTLSEKLQRRAEDIVAAETGLAPAEAKELLARAGGEPKVAIIMAGREVSADAARNLLAQQGGNLQAVLPELASERKTPPRLDLPGLFAAYASRPINRVIGLMSGTSADGVDAALVEISGGGETTGARLIAWRHQDYAADFRSRIFELFDPACPAAKVCEMNFVLGKIFGRAAAALAEEQGGLETIDLIASHGQTVSHLPQKGATLQIGEPAVIAEKTGITVAADFRVADVAAGGEGAPLTPFADYVLFRHPARGRAIQNIGGIANVTFLPPGCRLEEVIAFDTGPGNMLIDAVVSALTEGRQTFDKDGALGARGKVEEDLLTWLMSHNFISRRPPKTAGREEFGEAFAEEYLARAKDRKLAAEDIVATATAFTVRAIAQAYRQYLLPKARLDEIILGGGGAYNATLKQMLAQQLPAIKIYTHEDFNIPGQAKESLAFALLGHQTILGYAAGMPAVTGARQPAYLGKIMPGTRPPRSQS